MFKYIKRTCYRVFNRIRVLKMGKPKGGKRIRRGKKQNEEASKRTLEFKDEEQEYAFVTKNLGNCRLEVDLANGGSKIAIIPGKFRKRVWINKGDVLLVGIRGFQDDKVDVLHKYLPDEVRKLVQYEEVSAKWMDADEEGGGDENVYGQTGGIDFGDESSDEGVGFSGGGVSSDDGEPEKDMDQMLADL